MTYYDILWHYIYHYITLMWNILKYSEIMWNIIKWIDMVVLYKMPPPSETRHTDKTTNKMSTRVHFVYVTSAPLHPMVSRCFKTQEARCYSLFLACHREGAMLSSRSWLDRICAAIYINSSHSEQVSRQSLWHLAV